MTPPFIWAPAAAETRPRTTRSNASGSADLLSTTEPTPRVRSPSISSCNTCPGRTVTRAPVPIETFPRTRANRLLLTLKSAAVGTETALKVKAPERVGGVESTPPGPGAKSRPRLRAKASTEGATANGTVALGIIPPPTAAPIPTLTVDPLTTEPVT